MTTRLSFRPRQVDVNRHLPIVRDLKELDTGDSFASRGVTHGHEALDAENEQILTIRPKEKKSQAEIPVPVVNVVASYEEDYRPDFKNIIEYIRRPALIKKKDVIEYDLDSEDEAWLKKFNQGENALEDGKFELMLNKLEVACAHATESALSAAGAGSSERMSNSILASTDYLPRDLAFDALRTATGAKHSVLAAVYDYWQQKRLKWKKPLIRRLQAATNVSDTNPYNVFRPREKAHRPQTRRRRENDVASFEKMQDLRTNMEMAKELLECVLKREKKKRDVVYCGCDIQKLKIRYHHDPKNMHDQMDSETLTTAKSRTRKFTEPEPRTKDSEMLQSLFPIKPVLETFRKEDKIRKKKRRDERKPHHIVIPTLPPPPPFPEMEMLFTKKFTLEEVPFIKPPNGHTVRARIGRGGRLILERV